MLDFVNELFVRSPPNTTAWCDSLEAFLSSRTYKLESRDAIRRRFGNALQWYGNLIAQKEHLISGVINEGSLKYLAEAGSSLESDDIEGNQNYEPPPSSSPTSVADEASDDSDESHESKNTTNGESDLQRPSEYLRKRCPLCFGGDNPHDPNFMADIIVCIDACFTHKRRNPAKGGAKGPENLHPDTVFVPEKYVMEMKALVETVRPEKSKGKEKANVPSDGQPAEDSYEPGMKVPVSALEGCLASFIAEDERRTKASTQFFADTGLMAMLCHHDHVL
ncbi:uncharacterized protein LACBIDRAFT_317733 [Laccaria bicolor S238N-H82]|uniref:Predicted protein n=1 Tax=Laccaria bicolor (strain S238N-H82 / ATCC MYA-4686) TaxID=486041 RepID=B0E295_LACBS|nr:uncharacterized protein LACBIDRAFT_317733 [Laccaria bicolor S238N-H82]EDQ99039.1 predicted protein [Laccaria bicolor S238N-H82]|eukprot:XP_001890314.1 predicted protein [Laccaria bicolor S238N-H82]